MESIINKAVYGLQDNSIFGLKIISGVVVGTSYSEDALPKYEISFGKNRVWVQNIAQSVEELIKLFNLADLKRVKETHGLKLKYDAEKDYLINK